MGKGFPLDGCQRCRPEACGLVRLLDGDPSFGIFEIDHLVLILFSLIGSHGIFKDLNRVSVAVISKLLVIVLGDPSFLFKLLGLLGNLTEPCLSYGGLTDTAAGGLQHA